MRKPIKSEVLKTLRKRAGHSQRTLADLCGLEKESVSRIERGEQTGASPKTQQAFANAFKVDVAVLTGDSPIPPPVDPEMPDDPRQQWNVRVNGTVRNAFSLTALRYRIPVIRIIELAPLLFVAAAERSLTRRRTRLKAVKDALAQVDAVDWGFPHLPTPIAPTFEADQTIAAEEKSIEARDLLAERLPDDAAFWSLDSRSEHYEPEQQNPFVLSLKEEIADPALAEIDSFSRTDTDFRVCHGEAMRLAGKDQRLAQGILSGWAPLHEMPRALLADEALSERIAWLGQKADEHDAAMAVLLADLGATHEEMMRLLDDDGDKA